MREKYGFRSYFDAYYDRRISEGERWAMLLRAIKYMLECETDETYLDVAELLKDRNYYIVTTNQDGQFFRVFPDDRITRLQGDFRYFQCKDRCHDEIYDNKLVVDELYPKIEGDSLPENLIPRCPKCGGEMAEWVRSPYFLQGKDYEREFEHYMDFLRSNMNRRVLFLELGVGMMTPMFIKEPFINMVYQWPDAFYATVNPKHAVIPKEIAAKSVAIIIGISLNTAYVIVEAIFGFIYDSMGLLSDAGHNLSDVASLIIAMVAFRLMTRKPDSRHTYGYKKFSIQASFINALLLYVAVGAILVEAIGKLVHPTEVDGDAIAWVAAAGVLINGITTCLFMKDKSRDLNVKGAFMHMAADTLVSVGVVVSGIIIHFTGFYVLDPIIGIVIALIIAWSTKSLLVESTRMSIDAVPKSVDMTGLEKALSSVVGVKSIHHLHVWPLSTTDNAMTVHVVIEDSSELDQIISSIKHQAEQFGISHSTIQAETVGSHCKDDAVFNIE